MSFFRTYSVFSGELCQYLYQPEGFKDLFWHLLRWHSYPASSTGNSKGTCYLGICLSAGKSTILFYGEKKPGDSVIHNFCAKQSQHPQHHHTFHHVRQKIISGCAAQKYEAKRRYCTYHHPHKKSAIFYFTYLECKIKQIKGTLHNLAFILYQIAHNCNHKMIIFYHMCICKTDKGTGQLQHKKNGPVAPPSDLAGYYRSPN